MKMIEVRKELTEIALNLAITVERIKQLEEELYRRKSKRAPNASTPMSDEVAQEILLLRKQYPNWTLQKIADVTGVNIGRVSETLNGFRE